ncbi:tyrosine-protein kinase receptor TYRO3 [Trichomycterus rosablanca]|uniref:tyrosine-protein kinase receptor TYRO3 n=1 Tax=Trichomycterus rosablanca TaxID=2290929 RepID=UPI002F35DF90
MDMRVVLCLLSHYYLFSVALSGASAQFSPIKEEILDSTSERSLQWISQPGNAWQETTMKLGLDSAHSVYQGCEFKLKNKLKTLWTKWIPKKEAHELSLDLLFAQDDQIPVIIQLLESNEPVDSPGSGRKVNEVVARMSFSQVSIEDVEKHLHHAQGLNLGKISQKGFHLGFSYSGSCMFISSVRVFYIKCPGFTANQTSFGEASASSEWTRGQCVDGAKEVSAPMIECQSNGEWSVMQGSCVCGAGYQTDGDMCKACDLGSYKAVNDSGECRLCPPNSKTSLKGASECECNNGYARLQNAPPQLGCSRPPTRPRNLSIHRLNDTALVLNWVAPEDLGGREEIMYDVSCRQKTESHVQWEPCLGSPLFIPGSTELVETEVNITGLQPHVSYLFTVCAHNRISAILSRDGSDQSIAVWKTSVVIPSVLSNPEPTAAVKQELMAPVIGGVLCGVLLLLALIPATFCFIRKGYKKLRGDHDMELAPLQNNSRVYRRPLEAQTTSPQTSSSVQVLSTVNERLLCGIKDVLVDRSRVTLGKELGKGEFGAVFEGIFSPQEEENVRVAVKTMRVGIYSQDDLQSFLKEAEIMQHFDHDNVVKLLGVTLEQEQDSSVPVPLVILPFMKHGDLRRFLIATRYGDIPMFVPHQSLLRFMVDIATGMEYLSSKGFLHRDLAARNCMLGDDLRVRVADFGLSKQICNSNYYRQKIAIRMPIKWMAMESLSESIYTTKSDVWSFGVTMWEIVSRGRTPYPGIPNHELLEMLEHGYQLKQGDCESKLYKLMQRCWHKEPSQRPCFAELAQTLKELLCELPPLEPSKESYYINQGLEAASVTQSGAASHDPEEVTGNIYLPNPVGNASCLKQNEETKEDMEGGYLLCNKSETDS